MKSEIIDIFIFKTFKEQRNGVFPPEYAIVRITENTLVVDACYIYRFYASCDVLMLSFKVWLPLPVLHDLFAAPSSSILTPIGGR